MARNDTLEAIHTELNRRAPSKEVQDDLVIYRHKLENDGESDQEILKLFCLMLYDGLSYGNYHWNWIRINSHACRSNNPDPSA